MSMSSLYDTVANMQRPVWRTGPGTSRVEAPDQIPSWFPDWAEGFRRRAAPRPSIELQPLAAEDVHDERLLDVPRANEDGFERKSRTVIIKPNPDRSVRRDLGGLQIFMITFNVTLGTGLYWRGGQILELGGPLAVLLSFLFVGILAWAVMQCITELLCIWPIPDALPLYVSEFVDVELGIAVGIAYWFTYSVNFAGLIATAAAEINFWATAGNGQTIDSITYVAVLISLVSANCFAVRIYGYIETAFGSAKLVMFWVIICFVIAIIIGNARSASGLQGLQAWNSAVATWDKDAAPNWFSALLMSISFATFAYAGIESVAASALEARQPKQKSKSVDNGVVVRGDHRQGELIGSTVKFTAIWMSVLVTIAYTSSSFLASLNICWYDPSLPRLPWITPPANGTAEVGCANPFTLPQATTGSGYGSSTSVFVAIARREYPAVADAINVFLVLTALSCAGSNLYVASRTLYSLTARLDVDSGRGQHRLKRGLLGFLAWFGKTNGVDIPLRAVLVSTVFCFVPFLQLKPDLTSGSNPVGKFIEILDDMGSVGIVIVWACECWAFIRFYHCIERHREYLDKQKTKHVRRWAMKGPDDYPYRNRWQPGLAYGALAGCLFILLVANGASLWNGFQYLPFISSYVTIAVFLTIWAGLKYVRHARLWPPSLVKLDDKEKVEKKIRDLHALTLTWTKEIGPSDSALRRGPARWFGLRRRRNTRTS